MSTNSGAAATATTAAAADSARTAIRRKEGRGAAVDAVAAAVLTAIGGGRCGGVGSVMQLCRDRFLSSTSHSRTVQVVHGHRGAQQHWVADAKDRPRAQWVRHLRGVKGAIHRM